MIPKDYHKGLKLVFLLMAFVTLDVAKLLLQMSLNKLLSVAKISVEICQTAAKLPGTLGRDWDKIAPNSLLVHSPYIHPQRTRDVSSIVKSGAWCF